MTSSNNNQGDIKLNEFIFNSVVLVHLFDNKYSILTNILEYSLLSKRCFKIFQNLIISSPHKFIFPINNFVEYIIKNNNNNTYINQLIQYKHLETIKIQRIPTAKSILPFIRRKNNKNKKRKRENDGNSNIQEETFINQLYKNSKDKESKDKRYKGDTILKKLLNYYCPCLKEATVLGKIKPNKTNTMDFFKINKLSLYWDYYDLPVSEDDAIPNELLDDTHLYEYSFSFISKYNPTKIYISSEPGIHLENLNNLLNFKSIKSIHFDQHITPNSFITKVFQSTPPSSSTDNGNPNLRSLHLKIDLDEEDTLLDSEIHSNKTIKKLILNGYNPHELSFKLTEFLQLIQSNTTISTLGLHYFEIENSDQLLPLTQIKNINTLYCIFDCNIIKIFLDHCNCNSNIKKLVFYDQYGDYEENEIFDLFAFFIKNNNSSLEIIKFDFDFVGSEGPELAKPYNRLLLSNNYNNNEKDSKHLKLLFKFKE